jgi:two-component system CheB/CheR fusion protein
MAKPRTQKLTQKPPAPLPAPTDSSPEPTPEESPPLVPPSTRSVFPIVGIGASAGGLAAIEAFLLAMPDNNEKNFAFVIVQHLAPDHKSILGELLKRYTNMQVYEAEDGTVVMPNCAYIIPPNRDMALLNGKLQLFEIVAARSAHFSIDYFFRSLAADLREHAICIVLSGTGTDGTLGLRAIKGEGGLAIVQAPDTTEFDGMPLSAISTGLVDFILPPAEMPAQLLAFLNQTAARKQDAAPPSSPPFSPDVLAKIFVLLRAKTGHDFSQHKQNTILRRLERRMALHQIERVTDYLRYLQEHTEEVSALFRDLLIGVTSFFRDPEAFTALQTVAIPRLFASVPAGSTIRVWVCGCSTGEEAYSLAILMQEHLESVQQIYKVQIFATDIDRHATDHARTGVFPPSIVADVSAERLARFFSIDTNGSYRIEKAIRDLIVFAEQDVLKDPPFSKLNLITCRNLLIYLNADLQKRLIGLFHYALLPDGLLLLGNSETTGDRPLMFDVLDRKAKLFVRSTGEARALSRFVGEPLALPAVPGTLSPRRPEIPPLKRPPTLRETTEQSLLHHFARSAVLTDGDAQILYFHGRTGKYLEAPTGDAASNLLAMAREGLRRDLAAAFHRAVAKNEFVYLDNLQVKTNGHYVNVNLTILPVESPGSSAVNRFLVIFDERPDAGQPTPEAKENLASSAPLESRIAALEHQLRSKDSYIQTIVEEMESSGEELKSSNEEMQSVNEELQSTNEEMETSREELQSVNEELATLNAELRQKVADLSRANNDMNNLLAGTGVGTLFVDNKVQITRFTPPVTQIINLIETDIGRPLEHIVSNLVGHDHLITEVQAVLDTLVPLESEVQTKAGNWYILAIRPYRTLENVIEGAVVSFVDVTARKLAQQKQMESERFRHASQIETVGIAFFQLDGLISSANEAFLHMLDYTAEDLAAGKLDWSVITPPEWLPHTRKALKELNSTGKATPFEMQYLRKDGSRGKALFAQWCLDENEAVVYVISIAPES